MRRPLGLAVEDEENVAQPKTAGGNNTGVAYWEPKQFIENEATRESAIQN